MNRKIRQKVKAVGDFTAGALTIVIYISVLMLVVLLAMWGLYSLANRTIFY